MILFLLFLLLAPMAVEQMIRHGQLDWLIKRLNKL